MKTIALAVLLVALMGCHSREQSGSFRIGLATIEPLHGGVLQRLASRRQVLLTFDDGPENIHDDRSILATLAKHHARALWLVTCRRLDPSMDSEAGENRVTLQEIVARGHLIGNHGYSHIDLGSLDPDDVTREIAGCNSLISHLTGTRPVYFRPPFGKFSPEVVQIAKAQRMQMLLWSRNSYDSLFAKFKRQPGVYAPYIAEHPIYDVALNAEAGDVLLFHDYPNTALALDGILTRMEQRGFQFVVPQESNRL